MKIKDLIFEMVLEEGAKEQIKNGLLKRWSQEDADLSLETVNYIWSVFKGEDGYPGVVNKLKSKNDPIKVSFLKRFDGEHGFAAIDPTKILDINSYTLQQISSLLDDYGYDIDVLDDAGNEPWEETFFKGGTKEEKFDFSKNLWFGEQNKVYDDGNGFRLYLPLNQRQSVAFGMYENSLADKVNGSHWCTTWNRSGNMWNTYRSRNMTLYYGIDDNIPSSNQHHIFAILPKENDSETFEYTDLKNSGGNIVVKWSNPNDPQKSLVNLHPQLTQEGVRDIISKQVPYDPQKELNLSDEKLRTIDLIRETECTGGGPCYDFSVQPKRIKLQWILEKAPTQYLLELRSFQSMDEDLMYRYMETIDSRNWDNRFQRYEVLKYIFDTPKYKDKLERILRGEGVGGQINDRYNGGAVTIFRMLELVMDKKFDISLVSSNSDNVIVYRSNSGISDGKFGLFNRSAGDWYEKGGIRYEPEYSPIMGQEWPKTFFFKKDIQDMLSDREQNQPEEPTDVQEQDEVFLSDLPEDYMVTCYSKTNSADDTNNFYTVLDTRLVSNSGIKKGVIMSHSTFIGKFKDQVVERDWMIDQLSDEGTAPEWFKSQTDIHEKGV
jgi:hypothetical protein